MIMIVLIDNHRIDMCQEDKILFIIIRKNSIQTHYIQRKVFHRVELKDIHQNTKTLMANIRMDMIINTDTDDE